ncbi:MAG: hypothetical protein EU539_10185 [Promethearchaeota archaeon]|nr:MAG: hypothetical protein EU539_10185 [Candidatus Lokiarchaeota archaeon]
MSNESINSLQIEKLNNELEELELRSGIIGSVIIKRNGLLITSSLPRDIDHRKIGAMAAAIFGAIENASTTLRSKNKVSNLTVELDDYQIIILKADKERLFAALIDLNVNLGLILIEIEETIEKLKKIMKV